MPRFSYCAEMLLLKGKRWLKWQKALFCLSSPKSSLILMKALQGKKIWTTQHFQAMNIVKEVAVALVRGQQCVWERSSHWVLYCGWKHYFKINMMNSCTKLGQVGLLEVTTNTLKYKQDKQKGRGNIKRTICNIQLRRLQGKKKIAMYRTSSVWYLE